MSDPFIENNINFNPKYIYAKLIGKDSCRITDLPQSKHKPFKEKVEEEFNVLSKHVAKRKHKMLIQYIKIMLSFDGEFPKIGYPWLHPHKQDLNQDLNFFTKHYNQFNNPRTYNFINKLISKGYKFKLKDIYVLAQMAKDPTLSKLALQRDQLEKEISSKLKTLEHIGRPDRRSHHSDQLKYFTITHLAKIYWLLKNLECLEFRQQIGKLIQTDLNKRLNSELGGMVKFDNRKIRLNEIESTAEDNNKYRPKDKKKLELNGFFTSFHLHAVDIFEAHYAGPSMNDFITVRFNHWDGIVVSSLAKNEFNVDFYSNNEWELDLGCYTDQPFCEDTVFKHSEIPLNMTLLK